MFPLHLREIMNYRSNMFMIYYALYLTDLAQKARKFSDGQTGDEIAHE